MVPLLEARLDSEPHQPPFENPQRVAERRTIFACDRQQSFNIDFMSGGIEDVRLSTAPKSNHKRLSAFHDSIRIDHQSAGPAPPHNPT